MKYHLSDYGVNLRDVPIKCDNTNSISITKNMLLHYLNQHILVRYHFIRDHFEKKDDVIEQYLHLINSHI